MTDGSGGRCRAIDVYARSRTRQIGLIGFLGFVATGCATDAKSERVTAAAAKPVPASVASAAEPTLAAAPAEASASALPRAERTGLSAKLIYKPARPTVPPGAPTCAGSDRLDITEVRADAERLYVDVVHKGAAPDGKHSGEPGMLSGILLGGCPYARPPRVNGTVWRDWDDPSTLNISLADLPDGELDLTFGAHGAWRTVALLKTGTRVTHLRGQDRAGAMLLPPNPALGLPEILSLPSTDCGDEDVVVR